jgi:hypothetical protein
MAWLGKSLRSLRILESNCMPNFRENSAENTTPFTGSSEANYAELGALAGGVRTDNDDRNGS